MPRKEQLIEWQQADETLRKILPPGVELEHTLRGHLGVIEHISWSPDGQLLASSSADDKFCRWDITTGTYLPQLEKLTGYAAALAYDSAWRTLASAHWDGIINLQCLPSGQFLRTLEGHMAGARVVVFDGTGRTLASGGSEYRVKVWDATTGRIRHTMKGHSNAVNGLAYCLNDRVLASGGVDNTVRLWDTESGRPLRILEGHHGKVNSIAYEPACRVLATSSKDTTVKLWEPESGKLIRTLEGSTGAVTGLTFSYDGRYLASAGPGGILIWETDLGKRVAHIPENIGSRRSPPLAFHPLLPLLAVVGSDPGARESESDRLIHIYALDLAILSRHAAAPTVSYTSAKVVLVGESNVGKSYLAHRIATGSAPQEGKIKSTHGMKFWPLEAETPTSAMTAAPEKQEHFTPFAEKLFGQEAGIDKHQRRDIVLWDMGGQEEYRLIHQIFLHDTTVALVLLDPTRGATAFKEVEFWNKALDRQFRGRTALKLLVGAKIDQPSEMIDHRGLERLRKVCDFADYCETSAITGRGIGELCELIAVAIDWDALGKTSRPELFQRIRDEIETRRKQGEVVLSIRDLLHSLATSGDTDQAEAAVKAVTEQLAVQGLVALSKVSTGEPVMVLQVQEIERYAGSLILAARNNPRGVPALELRAIAQERFHFPEIAENERLPQEQERPVVECTVELMLEHGICFQHEGLLIFPTLFDPAPDTADGKLPHAVSLYYDFAGAIDNIYASLIAWLVLAKEFGKVRLWADRAEFEMKDAGLCGLLKKGRPGGFAHVDVYFEPQTPERQRQEFISFVEDHLSRSGLEIREHVTIKCPCGHEFAEETLRQRIARGDTDVGCPGCDTRHSLLTEGAAASRERAPEIAQHTWVLRTEIEKLREKMTKQAVEVLADAELAPLEPGPIRLLHLSDLHFTKDTPVSARLQWLLDDLKQDSGLGLKELDYLVITGDFTDKACIERFEKAYEFVSGLTQAFNLSAERCILVPGNHDVAEPDDAYRRRKDSTGLKAGEWFQEGRLVMVRDPDKYPLRFKPFSDSFYHKFVQRAYSTQTGQPFHRKLDTCSAANWTAVPGQTGPSERSAARG